MASVIASSPRRFELRRSRARLIALARLDVAVARVRMVRRQIRSVPEKLVAQGSRPIGRGISAALLEFRDEETSDVLECLGGDGIGEVETVDIGLCDPFLKNVGHR